MRVHTTAVPATKYLPERIHVKLTDDFDVPNNKMDRSFDRDDTDSYDDHTTFAKAFLDHFKIHGDLKKIGPTLTQKGFKYEIVESV